MSQIDDAFIQAYSRPSIVPLPPSEPIAGLHGGPHMHVLPADELRPETDQPEQAWSPEPIPSPHFRTVGVEQPSVVKQAAAAAPQEKTERRPLSSFAAPQQPVSTAFEPVFEVDAFRWPKVTDQLLDEHHQLLIPVADQLFEVSEQGRSLVGIAGTRASVGCTTLQLCLARLLAATGKSVALVDANFAKASLGRSLGLEFDMGWEDVLSGRMPLAECVVNSLEDKMALLPLARPASNAAELLAGIQTSVTAGVLRYHYDLVLFNLGAAAQPQQAAAASRVVQHCRLDANLVVADTTSFGSNDTSLFNPLLKLFGATCLGVIGNTPAYH